MENRSLDEFVNGDEPSDDGTRGEGTPAEPDRDGDTPTADAEGESEPQPEPGPGPGSGSGPGTAGDGTAGDGAASGIEPAVTTHAWSPTGGPCASCGAVVRRRWRDEPGLVCPDCKAW